MANPPITVEALIVLDAIAEQGSFAGAAEQLNKVPSALSYIVQKLEEQLAVTLFQRQGRRSVLTPAGKHLLAEGRQVLVALNKLSEQTKTIANGWEPKIRIAIDSIIDVRNIFPILAEFLTEHPNIELDIMEEVLNGTWEALIDDTVDLVIGAPEPIPVQKGIRSVQLTVNEMAFYTQPQSALAQLKRPITIHDIESETTIIVHDSAKRAIPISANVIEKSQHIYVPTLDYKIQAIIAGLGCGYLPKKRVQGYVELGQLVELTTAHQLSQHPLHIAWKIVNHGKGLQRLTQRLTEANLATML
ncbi:MAG: LysR substrate-binding domain-containing protein [Thalassotalea sp.]